jgi:CheY-like chemotaxis protein
VRLLIVDDDDTLRELLYDLFSEKYSCAAVGTAEEALTRIGSQPFDVIITDIMMPGMSGTDLLGFIRKYQPQAAVIVISGGDEQVDEEKLRLRGVFKYLRKPFSRQEIEGNVARAIERHRH